MEIKELVISNYKSIQNISIKNPNPFTVFVGPNAAGKSNIFEALEFYTHKSKVNSFDLTRLFGDVSKIGSEQQASLFKIEFNDFLSMIRLMVSTNKIIESENFIFDIENDFFKSKYCSQFYINYSRIFVNNERLDKFNYKDNWKLTLSCENLEAVLKRILVDENKRQEIIELLEILIPGFENIEIKTEELSGTNNLLIYEKGLNEPLNKRIISDGTYNIIALLTALYQSDEPQFLCIEEPENGLNPKVVRELVSVFRKACKEKGHFIWLNTHSQTLVSELTPEEIILVDKIDGNTQVKQIQGMNLHGLKMDEALLTNALGGGIPW